jgi:hypothetical protein
VTYNIIFFGHRWSFLTPYHKPIFKFGEERQVNLIYGKEWPCDAYVDLIRYGTNSFQNFISNGQNAARFLNLLAPEFDI